MISVVLSVIVFLRATLRLVRTALHLLWGCATVSVVFPFVGTAVRRHLKQRWSRQLVGILGVRIVATGGHLPSGLVVANHISFLDIFVINAVAPAAFVSKDEVRDWPVIGWLCTHTETLFLARGSRAGAQKARETIVEELHRGSRIAVFPEGTSTRGDSLLPFHSALFQSALDAESNVIPLALRYTNRSGQRDDAAAYVDDISLIECFWAIACASGLQAHIEILPSLDGCSGDRRHLSASAHRAISHRLNPSPSVPPAADRAAGTLPDLPAAPLSAHRPTDNPNPGPAASLPS